MWTNYLKIAYRNLLKHKTNTTVNILGLSLGIAVALLISTFVLHEYSFDKWIPNSENTYRIYRSWGSDGGTAWSPSHLAGKLTDDFPEIEAATGISPRGETLVEYGLTKLYVEEVAQVDSTFFQVVQLPYIAGDPLTALQKPKSLVIAQSLAARLFGDENPLGKTLKYDSEEGYTVMGVFDTKGQNVHLDYEIYTPFTWYSDSWTGNNRATYAKVKSNTDIALLESKITEAITKLILMEYDKINHTPTQDDLAAWKLQPMHDIYLHSSDIGWISGREGNIRYLYIFIVVAILLLFIALINYVNLATAQASERAQEVGVRKVSGAVRTQLVRQFLSESTLQAIGAGIIGLALSKLLLPIFSSIVDRNLDSILWSPTILTVGGVLLFAVLVGLIAGFYPALILSSFQPSRAFSHQGSMSQEKGTLRKILVTTQFAITLSLLIVMAFIYRQVNHMLNHDLGFNPDQVVSIIMNDRSTQRKVTGLKEQFLNIPGVKNISLSSTLPGRFIPDWGMKQEGREEMLNPNVIFADEGFLSTLQIGMIEGRFLSSEFAQDTVNNFVVNQTFVDRFQIEDPIGTRVKFSSEDEFGTIVGVCEDFHFTSVTRDVRPLVIGGQGNRWYTSLQVETKDLSATVASITDLWSRIEPDHPIRLSFLDAEFQKQYEEHQRLGKSMLYATILTLFIALMGLFGLTAFMVRKRMKEIGIRKVLGASSSGIVALFLKDFLRVVSISFLIALPIGYLATNRWLEDFASRITMEPWTFLGAFLLILMVTIGTVALRTLSAARSNPVNSLRSE